MWIGLAGLFTVYATASIYEQVFGWRAGLDSFSPEFQTYWLTILWTEIPLELVSGLAIVSYLWKTRTRRDLVHRAEGQPPRSSRSRRDSFASIG